MENNREHNVNNSKTNSVFTEEVQLLSKTQHFFNSLGNGCLKIVLWLADFILSLFLSLGHFFLVVAKGVYVGAISVINFFKRKIHQFKYNDVYGRISFGVFGLSSIKHGQIVNGILYMVFEVAYIVLFALFGIPAISKLNLPEVGMEETLVCDELGMCWSENVSNGNSILLLIFGLLWSLSILIFLYIWNRSINAGYQLYRIKNFVAFDSYSKNVLSYSEQLSADAIKAFESGISKKEFVASKQADIDEYISAIRTRIEKENENNCVTNEDGSVTVKKPDYTEADYTLYLVKNTISDAYAYCKQRTKLIAKVEKANAKKDAYLQKRAAVLEKGFESDFQEEKYKNKTLAGTSRRDLKINKAVKALNDFNKRYSCTADRQNTKNNKLYGKFNFYYKNIARIEREKTFWENYAHFVDIYNNSLGGSDEQNAKNAENAKLLDATTREKMNATVAKYEAIDQKRNDIEAQIAHVKHQYNEEVLRIKASGGDATALLDAKAVLVDETTKLNRMINDVPNAKVVKEMRKEELKEIKQAYRRDKKYFKTNYTPTSYARQCVIDDMLLTFKFDYKEAVAFTNILCKNIETQAEINPNDNVAALEEEKANYEATHTDKYVGRPVTFIEQMKGLLNQNFHITILFLPLLGIVLFTIVPLIFSILVAFTNYSKDHIPPTQWFTWIGIENFLTVFVPSETSVFKDLPAALLSTLSWTLIWAVFATFSNYFLGIIVALMINKEDIKFKKLWRTIFVLTIAVPQFISLLSIATLIKDTGALGQLWLDIFGSKLGFATSQNVLGTKIIVILVNVWIGIPYTILSTTGILLNIPKDLYESSKVDGAGTFTQFMKITMPYIFFVTGPYLITQFVGNINNFNVIFFLTGGDPALSGSSLAVGQTDLLITFLYELITSATNPQYGIASTIGIVIFVICSLFSIVMYNKSGSIKQEDQFQ